MLQTPFPCNSGCCNSGCCSKDTVICAHGWCSVDVIDGSVLCVLISWQCLSSALRSEKHNPRALVMASALMIPFQPLLVTAVHTGLMEAHFAAKSRENPKLRRVHSLHTMSSLVGGALFASNHVFNDTPYVHAAWHLAAAVSVATLGTMLQDSP